MSGIAYLAVKLPKESCSACFAVSLSTFRFDVGHDEQSRGVTATLLDAVSTCGILNFHLDTPQVIGLDPVHDLSDVARFNDDRGPIGLKAVLVTDIPVEPLST